MKILVGIRAGEVNLLNLWLEEEDFILDQVRTCRRDLSREETRLRSRVSKVVNWLKEKGRQEEEWRDERAPVFPIQWLRIRLLVLV